MNTEQKQRFVGVCEDLCQLAQYDAKFMSRIITRDESCVYNYNPETKKKNAVFPVEEPTDSMTDEDASGQQGHQERAHCCFSLTFTGSCTMNSSLHPSHPDITKHNSSGQPVLSNSFSIFSAKKKKNPSASVCMVSCDKRS